MTSPLIAITMGDPAGIGPEIIIKALEERVIFDQCRPVVLGDEGILSDTVQWLASTVKIKQVEVPAEGTFTPGTIDLIPVTQLPPGEVVLGSSQARGGGGGVSLYRAGGGTGQERHR